MYQSFGGATGIRTLTDRFYDLMELEPQYQALRQMHGEDMTLIREKLYEFFLAAGSAARNFLSKIRPSPTARPPYTFCRQRTSPKRMDRLLCPSHERTGHR